MGDKRPWILRQLEAFIFDQNLPMTEVTIVHDKGKWYPRTVLVNKDNNQEFEAVVDSIDENTIIVRSNLAVRFVAYIY